VAELPELPESWVETLTGGELAAEAEIEAEVDQADIDRVLTRPRQSRGMHQMSEYAKARLCPPTWINAAM
jgi:hypothetical protein